jgi:hypothetical protein
MATGIKVHIRVSVGLKATSPSCIVKKGPIFYHALVVLVTSDGEYVE